MTGAELATAEGGGVGGRDAAAALPGVRAGIGARVVDARALAAGTLARVVPSV